MFASAVGGLFPVSNRQGLGSRSRDRNFRMEVVLADKEKWNITFG